MKNFNDHLSNLYRWQIRLALELKTIKNGLFKTEKNTLNMS